jgi:hypothetical protein
MTEPMTDERKQAIRVRCEAATPGPWRSGPIYYDESEWQITYADVIIDADETKRIASVYPQNADFIAHARQDVPALLAEIERLEAENTVLRDQTEFEVFKRDMKERLRKRKEDQK